MSSKLSKAEALSGVASIGGFAAAACLATHLLMTGATQKSYDNSDEAATSYFQEYSNVVRTGADVRVEDLPSFSDFTESTKAPEGLTIAGVAITGAEIEQVAMIGLIGIATGAGMYSLDRREERERQQLPLAAPQVVGQ